jgi:MYXO-CTERM domain-containing protein
VASGALGLGLGLIVLYVALLADGRPLQVWDSWVTWGMKARLIWQTDTIPTGVYADPTRAVTLLDYPLLVPLLEAWLYTWLGAPDDRLAGLVNVLSYAALLGLAFTAVRARGASALAGLVAAAYVASIWGLAGLAGLAFADVSLALFALLTGVYLVRWLEDGSPATLVVAAIAGGALGWTKREGLVLVALFVLAGLLGARGSRRWAAPALAVGGLVIAGPWLAFVTWRGLPDWQFVPISLQTALDNRERLGFVFGTLARWSVESDWGLPSVWLLGLLGLGLSVARRGVRPPDLLPLVGAGYLLLMTTAYLFSTFVPYQTHVLASLGRLMAHVAPAVGVWLVSRWLEVRPGVVRLPRRPPADAAPAIPRGSSTDRRTPALEGLGTPSGATLLPRPRPGTPPD